MTDVYFYRRSIEIRAGTKVWVVYAVIPVDGQRPDPVPVVAGFPENWKPVNEVPGICLFQLDIPTQIYLTAVPRGQFRHFERISEAEALALYPELLV